MSTINVFNQLVCETVNSINSLITKQVITNQIIRNYSKMSKMSLHSWLQYCLLESARKCDIVAVPEVKIHYSAPLNPTTYGIQRKRKRHFKRVDVAFYDLNLNFMGFAEVITVDEAHGGISSSTLTKPWLTSRDTIPYTVNYAEEKPDFVILLNVLPDQLTGKPWKTTQKKDAFLKKTGNNYYSAFYNEWKNVTNILTNLTSNCKMITIVDVNNIQTYP